MIRLARVYDRPSLEAGSAFLVERLWPRGVRKDALGSASWSPRVAPSRELRVWFSHDPERWQEFRRRYFAELDADPQAWRPLAEAARAGEVTLLYSSRDREHNNAVALRDYLQEQLAGPPGR